jgi:two-component sensor histidine kinase/CheY-like chemotaxis protein
LERINNELERRVKERTSELEAAIAQQELLAREVDHRARNALAVIQSIVAMMPPTPGAAMARIIEGRIRAMARAHTLLSQARWEGADLSRLVNEELEPFRAGDRVNVHGEAAAIKPSVAQNFALAIHELATNAAKYGALSAPDGRLDVSWTLGNDALILQWTESGGPPSEPPTKTGFGSKVIDASIKRQLNGDIEREWSGDGLRCVVRVPAEHFSPPAAHLVARVLHAHEETSAAATENVRGKRLLLVEDEPLVAMMMSQVIRDLGGEVVGPFGSMAEVVEESIESIDAAVLDVNVAGQLVYPLADRVASLHKPMVFLTGYDAKSVDPRFADSPILTKPIDERELAAVLADMFEGSRVASALAG